MAHRTRRDVPMVRETAASYVVQLAPRGRLVLPAGARGRLGLREGDRLILTVEADGNLRMRSVRDVVRSARGMFRHLARGRSVVAELLEERRREARREEKA